MNASASELKALRAERAAAGDQKLAKACDRALVGSKAALKTCLQVMANERSQLMPKAEYAEWRKAHGLRAPRKSGVSRARVLPARAASRPTAHVVQGIRATLGSIRSRHKHELEQLRASQKIEALALRDRHKAEREELKGRHKRELAGYQSTAKLLRKATRK